MNEVPEEILMIFPENPSFCPPLYATIGSLVMADKNKFKEVHIGCFYRSNDPIVWFFPVKRSSRHAGFEGWWYNTEEEKDWVYSDFVMDPMTFCDGVEPKAVPLAYRESLRQQIVKHYRGYEYERSN